jgi:CBS domain containing-hemolysin-like protein
MLDTIQISFEKHNFINYFFQILCWGIVCVVSIRSINKISSGYIPIYLFLFLLVGGLLYYYFVRKEYIKILLKIRGKRRNLLLALFPINLYNYIIKKVKQLTIRRKQKNEENNVLINDDSSSVNNSRM